MNSRFHEIDINDLEPRQAPKRSVFTPSTAFIPTVPEVSVMFQESFINTSETSSAPAQLYNNKDERTMPSLKSPPLVCASPTCHCGFANKSGPNSSGQRHEKGPPVEPKYAGMERPADGRRNQTMPAEISNKHGSNTSNYPGNIPQISLPTVSPKLVCQDILENGHRNKIFREISTQTEVERIPLFFQSEEWKSCMSSMSGVGKNLSDLHHKVDRICEFMQCTHQAVQNVNTSVDKVSSDIINLASRLAELEKQCSSLNKDPSTSSSPIGLLMSPYNNDAGEENDWTHYNKTAKDVEVVNNCHSEECDCQKRESVTSGHVGVKDILMQHQQLKQQMEQAALQGSNMVPGSFMINHPGQHTDEELNALAVASGGTTADIGLNNMSFSTVDYLQRHGILRSRNDQNQVRFPNLRKVQDAECNAEKHFQACGGAGCRCCAYHIENDSGNAKSNSRLLDITAIKRLPKLT